MHSHLDIEHKPTIEYNPTCCPNCFQLFPNTKLHINVHKTSKNRKKNNELQTSKVKTNDNKSSFNFFFQHFLYKRIANGKLSYIDLRLGFYISRETLFIYFICEKCSVFPLCYSILFNFDLFFHSFLIHIWKKIEFQGKH